MDDSASGFFSQIDGYGQPDLSTFTPIPNSEGAFCSLFRGERAGKFRVYKCLKPQYRGDILYEGLLKKEFESGYSLRHENICEFYSYLEIEGLGNCIEMEWVDGITLDGWLKANRCSEATFRNLAAQLCDALGYIHSRQMLHRDLKPSNIMISHQGQIVKLIDFGLADDVRSSVYKAAAGSRWWVAPEVLGGEKATVRSDIYSLGAVLRIMTSRHRACIDRCTSEDPARRYSSAGEVAKALLKGKPWLPLLAASAAIAVLAGAFLYLKKAETPPQGGVSEPAVKDTIYVMPKAPEGKPAVQQPAGPGKPEPQQQKRQTDSEETLDEIFEQASDLFEEKL